MTNAGRGYDLAQSARIALPACLLAVGAIVAACGTPARTPVESAAATTGPASASTPVPSPAATPSLAPCASLPATGSLPGPRLVAVAVVAGPTSDRVTLTFEPARGGIPGPLAAPEASLDEARPPFVHGASGLPLVVAGSRFLSLILRNMTIADEDGQAVYRGPTDFPLEGAGIRQVVQSEAFEGVYGWIIGLAADAGCARLDRSTDGRSVTIEFPHT